MSEIQRFSKALLEDKDLEDGLKDIGNEPEKIVQYANSKGFHFSEQELVAAVKENETLSEEELDDVTGGFLTAVVGVSFQIGDTGLTVTGKAKAGLVL